MRSCCAQAASPAVASTSGRMPSTSSASTSTLYPLFYRRPRRRRQATWSRPSSSTPLPTSVRTYAVPETSTEQETSISVSGIATEVVDFEQSSPPIPPSPSPHPPPLARPPPPATEKKTSSPSDDPTPILSDPLAADEAWWSARLSVADASDLPASSRPRRQEKEKKAKRGGQEEEEKTATATAKAKKEAAASSSSSSADSESDSLSPRPRQQQQQHSMSPPVSKTAALAAELAALPLGADPGSVLEGVPLCGKEVDRLLAHLLDAPTELQQRQQRERQQRQQRGSNRDSSSDDSSNTTVGGGGGVCRALSVFHWLDSEERRDLYGTDDPWIVARLMGAAARARGGVPGPPQVSSKVPPSPPASSSARSDDGDGAGAGDGSSSRRPPSRRQPLLSGAEAALALYDRFVGRGGVPDLVTANAALAAAGKAGDWRRAEELYDEIRGGGSSPRSSSSSSRPRPLGPADAYTYTAFITAASRCGQPASVSIEALEEARRAGATAAKAAAAAPPLTAAASDASSTSSASAVAPPPNVLSTQLYTAAISAAGKASDPDAAARAFRALEQDGGAADVVAYNALLSALARAGAWQRAWAVVGAMRRVGISPNVRSYNSLLSACEGAGEGRRAMEVLDRVEREAGLLVGFDEERKNDGGGGEPGNADGSPPPTRKQQKPLVRNPSDRGFYPTSITYNTALAAVAKAGDLRAAREILKRAARARCAPDAYTLSSFLRAIERSGSATDLSRCREEFARLVAAGAVPNAASYNALLSALARAGDGDGAREVLAFMERGATAPRGREGPSSSSSSSYFSRAPPPPDARARSHVVAALALQGRGSLPEALRLFREMRRRREPLAARAASALLAACEASGAFQDGKEVFAAIQEAARALEGRAAVVAEAERVVARLAAAATAPSSSSLSSPLSPSPASSSSPSSSSSSSSSGAGEGILFAGRKLVYSVPGLLQSLPPPLIGAARAAVEGGQAARRWVGENTQQDKGKGKGGGGGGSGGGKGKSGRRAKGGKK